MIDTNNANSIQRLFLDESKGGIRSLPKTVRFQLLVLLSWPIFIALTLVMRDPSQMIWSLAVVPSLLTLYFIVKFILPRMKN